MFRRAPARTAVSEAGCEAFGVVSCVGDIRAGPASGLSEAGEEISAIRANPERRLVRAGGREVLFPAHFEAAVALRSFDGAQGPPAATMASRSREEVGVALPLASVAGRALGSFDWESWAWRSVIRVLVGLIRMASAC